MNEKNSVPEAAENPTTADAEIASKPVSSDNKKHHDVEKGKPKTNVTAKNIEVKDKRKKFVSERINHAAKHSKHPCSLMKKLLMIIFHTIGFLILIGFILLIPVTMIVIASININNCAVEYFIPIWLIVNGAVYIAMLLVFILVGVKNTRQEELPEDTRINSVYSTYNFLLTFFLFAWFIAGNVWVFRAFRPNITDELAPNFCDAATYYLAFVCIIISYVLLIVALCCSSCIACISVYAVSTREKIYHLSIRSTDQHHHHDHAKVNKANYSENEAEEKKENKVAETSV